MMKIFLTRSVIFVENSELDEFVKFDYTKGQVNLEILLSDESESDDSSVGSSEAEEVADYVSGGSDLAVITEDEDDARRSSSDVLVWFLFLSDIVIFVLPIMKWKKLRVVLYRGL
jgi:hypothetical protein